MSRGIIVNNPGAIETVVNLTTIKALDGDTIYAGSVWLSNISSDEIEAVRNAVEEYSGSGPDRYDEGYTDGYNAGYPEGDNDAKHAIAVDHQPIAEEYQTKLPGVADIQSQDPTQLAGQRNIFSIAADYLSEEEPDPSPKVETEPYYIDGWFEHQEGNWIVLEGGITIHYKLPNDDTIYTVYIMGNTGWKNVDNAEWRMAEAIWTIGEFFETEFPATFKAMNIELPNYIGGQITEPETPGYQVPFSFWKSDHLVNIKLKVDHFEGSVANLFRNCRSMITCEIEEMNRTTPSSADKRFNSANGMFKGCESLLKLDLTKINFYWCGDFNEMFSGCSWLQKIDISNLAPHFQLNATTKRMFYNCASLQSIEFSPNFTIEISDMSEMFRSCQSLQYIKNCPKATYETLDARNMFNTCYSLRSLDLSGWNVYNCNFSGLFTNCISLQELDVSNWIWKDWYQPGADTFIQGLRLSVSTLKINKFPYLVEAQDQYQFYMPSAPSPQSVKWIADNIQQAPSMSGISKTICVPMGWYGWSSRAGRLPSDVYDYFKQKLTAKGWYVNED